MKPLTVLVTFFVILSSACSSTPSGPSEAVMQAVYLTQTARAWTLPTFTSTPTLAPGVTLAPTFSPVPSGTPVPTFTPGNPAAQALNNPAACVRPDAVIQLGLVSGVVDGDTINVLIDEIEYQVSYIGVEAPEINPPDGDESEAYALEAAAKNAELVNGQLVILVQDISETDPTGVLLRYVFLGDQKGLFVNYELVRQGYANAVSMPPNIACSETLFYAQLLAKQEGLGLWGPAGG